MTEHYDVVVVGGGTSGGTLASRLSDDPARRVLLLEAGPDFPDELARTPAFFTGGSLVGQGAAGSGPPIPDVDWGYVSEPLPNGRRVPLTRGKLMGGSGMINGCVFVRGRPSDFDRWVEAGATGWGWEDVLPYHERVETEVPIMTYPREVWLPVQTLFVEGCDEAGFRWVDDFNAPDSWDGIVGHWPRNRHNEIRMGSLVTYVRKARGRPNFEIRDRVLVDRVLFSGTRATGVAYVDRDGRAQQVEAGHVVLSAGAYGSAPILLRSGVGPAEELRALGIEPVVDLPVGRRLLEHPGLTFRVQADPAYARIGWPSNAAAGRGVGYWSIPRPFDQEEGVIAFSYFLALIDGPEGSIRLRSTDPDAAPIIDHRFQDIADSGFDVVWSDFQELLATPAFRRAGARDAQDGTPLPERVQAGLGTGTHPAGGCGIGSVVDPDLRVYGVEQLSVADASIFPIHMSNNPNLMCFVVGEIAAAKLAG